MIQNALALNYQRLIQVRFPTCIVADVGAAPEDTTVLDAFFIPNDQVPDFEEFFYNTVRPQAEQAGMDWALVIPHSTSNTLLRYPTAQSLVTPATLKVANAVVQGPQPPKPIPATESEAPRKQMS